MRYVILNKKTNFQNGRKTKKIILGSMFTLLFAFLLVVPTVNHRENANREVQQQSLRFENNGITKDGSQTQTNDLEFI